MNQEQKKKWGIIYNPKAGTRKVQKRWQEIKDYMDSQGVAYDYVQSEGFGSVERLAGILAENGYRTIVIVGGDGALNDAINGIMHAQVEAKEDIARSLEALQTDYIDLLLIHEPYEAAPEMYLAMEEACAAGLVRAVGLSNFSGEEYLRFLKHCRVTPAVDQVESHVYHPQLALKKLLEEKGTRMQAWASFTEGRRNIFAEPVLAEAGRRHGKTAAQTALRYLVENGIPVLPKSAHRERLRENLDIFDFSLTDEERRAIAALDEGRSLFGWF